MEPKCYSSEEIRKIRLILHLTLKFRITFLFQEDPASNGALVGKVPQGRQGEPEGNIQLLHLGEC